VTSHPFFWCRHTGHDSFSPPSCFASVHFLLLAGPGRFGIGHLAEVTFRGVFFRCRTFFFSVLDHIPRFLFFSSGPRLEESSLTFRPSAFFLFAHTNISFPETTGIRFFFFFFFPREVGRTGWDFLHLRASAPPLFFFTGRLRVEVPLFCCRWGLLFSFSPLSGRHVGDGSLR